MDMKAMDAGEFTEESKNLGKTLDAGEGFKEEGKNFGDKKSLKRPIDAIDDDDDGGGGGGGGDDDGFTIYQDDGHLIDCSNIQKTFENPNFKNITSRLEGNVQLAERFRNILNILTKEDITSDDAAADDFKKVVEDVLGNDHFLAELYREFEDDWCISMVEYCAKKTQLRVDKESTKDRMALIRSDNYFSHASVGENNETIIRGAISIIVSYCLSLTALRKIWIRGHNDEQFRWKFGLKDFD